MSEEKKKRIADIFRRFLFILCIILDVFVLVFGILFGLDIITFDRISLYVTDFINKFIELIS